MKVRSKDEILDSMISNFKLDIPVYEGTLTYAIFSSVANAIAREYTIKDEEEKQVFLVDGRAEFLDKRASEFGYDRKDGELASGSVVFVGSPGTLIKDGLIIKCNSLEFVVSEGGSISSEGEGRAIVKALEVGSAGNIKAGSDFTCEEIEFDRIFNENDFKNGIDVESDEDFYTRVFYTQRNKGTSGNEDHYNEWAKSIDGVVDAKTTGEKNGPGTVEVVVAGKENVVSEDILRKVREYIERSRPVGPKVTVKSMSNFDVDIVATVKSAAQSENLSNEYKILADEYLNSCKDTIVFAKLYSTLASMADVEDISSYKINNDIKNIPISSEQKARVRTVTIKVVN